MAVRSSRLERDRIRYALALDAAGIIRRLEEHHDEMVGLFSRLRDREALTSPLRTTLDTIRFSELVRLTLREQKAVHLFHEAVDDLRWYLRYTVDMPGMLEQKFGAYLKLLTLAHVELEKALGPVSPDELNVDLPPLIRQKRRKKSTAARRDKPSKRR
jgi:hypothetical protein